MKVTYNSPNRSHHYRYAAALARAGLLRTFVSGFSRFSSRAALPGVPVVRADEVQNLYLAALRLHAPAGVCESLAHAGKWWLDRCSTSPALESDLFLCYSGAGLHTLERLRGTKTVGAVEAVNCHVRVQERIMREELGRLGLPVTGFPKGEVGRRLREYDLADAILCPSHFVRESFVNEGFPAERVHVVPYGIPKPEGFTPGPAAEDGAFQVLYVGQLAPRKGVRYLVEAFALLRHPKKELLIVGPRSTPSGLEGVSLPDNVRFAGVLKGEDLARAYAGAAVLVLPTLEEGLALVLGEALAQGTPVIATVNSGGADLFRDGEEGFLVPVRDPAALADRMQRLADDPALREGLSRAARARMRELGGWERTDARLVDAVRAMAALGRKANFTAATA